MDTRPIIYFQLLQLLANHSYEENELILRVAEGDEKAFKTLFDLHWDKIYSVAFVLTKSSEISEELVQDIFLKIWLKRDQLSQVQDFGDYLFIVARNHIYNELRKKLSQQLFIEHLEQFFAEPTLQPEKQFILKETEHLVHKAVEKLPTQQRAVYELSRNEGYNHIKIAEKLGISRLTVKSHMTKALHFIRSYLHHHSDELVLFMLVLQTWLNSVQK